jgi:aspartyl-tRNA(Asn)/glutamyl-tRNA(Gln) amidotransferase subunit B
VGSEKFGTRVEMKNVNSFSGAVRAIEYRRRARLTCCAQAENPAGNPAGTTRRRQRSFALQKTRRIRISPSRPFNHRRVRGRVQCAQRQPARVAQRAPAALYEGARPAALRRGTLVDNPERAALFEETLALGTQPKAAANWLNGDVVRILAERAISLPRQS